MRYLVSIAIFCLLVAFPSVVSLESVVSAQTPDGPPPPNEGVCDELIGYTPGLYGLCVAFCEAQDCEATFDPATGNMTFDPSCRPSNPKILEKYNRRMNPGDPMMPCVNVAESECPCWTEAELDAIADGRTDFCGDVIANGLAVDGVDWATGDRDLAQVFTFNICFYQENTPLITTLMVVDPAEVTACFDSILAECASR